MMNLTIASLFLRRSLATSPLFSVNEKMLHLRASRFSYLLAPVVFARSNARVFLHKLEVERVLASAAVLAVDVEECNRIEADGSQSVELVPGEQSCVYLTGVNFKSVTATTGAVVVAKTDVPIVVDGVTFESCSGLESGGFSITGGTVVMSNVNSSGCSVTTGGTEPAAEKSAAFGVFVRLARGSEFRNIRIKNCLGVAGQASAMYLSNLELMVDGMFVNRSDVQQQDELPMVIVSSCVDLKLFNVTFAPRNGATNELALDCLETPSIFVQRAYFDNFKGHSIQLSESYIVLTYACFGQAGLSESVKLKSGTDLSMFVFQSYVVFDPKCQFTPSPSPELTATEKIYGITTTAVFFAFFVVLFIVFIVIIAKSRRGKEAKYGGPIVEEEDVDEFIESD